jgi:hypothetical protein
MRDVDRSYGALRPARSGSWPSKLPVFPRLIRKGRLNRQPSSSRPLGLRSGIAGAYRRKPASSLSRSPNEWPLFDHWLSCCCSSGGWASNLNSGDAGHPDEHAGCGRLIGSRGGVLSDCGSCYSEPYDNEDRHSADGLHAALLWSKPRHCGVNRTPRPARKFHTTTDPFVRCSLERAGVFPHTISRSSASTRALRRRFPNDHYRRFDTRLLWRQ